MKKLLNIKVIAIAAPVVRSGVYSRGRYRRYD